VNQVVSSTGVTLDNGGGGNVIRVRHLAGTGNWAACVNSNGELYAESPGC
jgi:hypothetical protein